LGPSHPPNLKAYEVPLSVFFIEASRKRFWELRTPKGLKPLVNHQPLKKDEEWNAVLRGFSGLKTDHKNTTYFDLKNRYG